MSKELESKVWASGLPEKIKPVAALLADIANPDGSSIYPSVAHIAWSLGSHDCAEPAPNERTIQRHIEELLTRKVLVFVGWNRRGVLTPATDRRKPAGPGATAEYRLEESELPIRRPWRERYGVAESTDTSKGDKLSPLDEQPPLEVTTEPPKGDKTDELKVTTHMVTTHMVTPVSPKPDPYPSDDPSDDPSKAHARDADVTGSREGAVIAANVDAQREEAAARGGSVAIENLDRLKAFGLGVTDHFGNSPLFAQLGDSLFEERPYVIVIHPATVALDQRLQMSRVSQMLANVAIMAGFPNGFMLEGPNHEAKKPAPVPPRGSRSGQRR